MLAPARARKGRRRRLRVSSQAADAARAARASTTRETPRVRGGRRFATPLAGEPRRTGRRPRARALAAARPVGANGPGWGAGRGSEGWSVGRGMGGHRHYQSDPLRRSAAKWW